MKQIKIETHSGCTTDCICVNGENTADMDEQRLANIIAALLKQGYHPDIAYLQSWIDDIAKSCGIMETLYHCEQCNDTVIKTTLIVEIDEHND